MCRFIILVVQFANILHARGGTASASDNWRALVAKRAKVGSWSDEYSFTDTSGNFHYDSVLLRLFQNRKSEARNLNFIATGI